MSRDNIVSVRLTETEHSDLKKLAEDRNLSVSALVRTLIKPAPKPVQAQTWASGSSTVILWDKSHDQT